MSSWSFLCLIRQQLTTGKAKEENPMKHQKQPKNNNNKWGNRQVKRNHRRKAMISHTLTHNTLKHTFKHTRTHTLSTIQRPLLPICCLWLSCKNMNIPFPTPTIRMTKVRSLVNFVLRSIHCCFPLPVLVVVVVAAAASLFPSIGWFQLIPRGTPLDPHREMLAVDCEMVCCAVLVSLQRVLSPTNNVRIVQCVTGAAGLELTRVSVVDERLQVIYDKLVKPANPISDYLTRYNNSVSLPVHWHNPLRSIAFLCCLLSLWHCSLYAHLLWLQIQRHYCRENVWSHYNVEGTPSTL